jgi:hypothetical protein
MGGASICEFLFSGSNQFAPLLEKTIPFDRSSELRLMLKASNCGKSQLRRRRSKTLRPRLFCCLKIEETYCYFHQKMEFGCCSTVDDGVENVHTADRDNSLVTCSHSGSHDDDSIGQKSETLDCDYKHATPLFKAIEDEDWKGVLVFLSTGKWSNSSLTSTITGMQNPPAERQVRTWVTSTDKHGEVQWSQLPIHAAISYMAPLPIIQKIVEIHPSGLRSADDTGNLPLHLAFGFGSPDCVVAYLIKEFPQALSLRGLQNRLPVECSDLGSNKVRGEIVQACQDHVRNFMMKDWDHHWKRSLSDAKKRAGLTGTYAISNKTLEEVFDEFMEVKKELEKAKQNAKNRPTMIITKTELAETTSLPSSPKTVGHTPSDKSGVFSFVRKASSKVGKTKNKFTVKKGSAVAPLNPRTP